jgi:hypothetical protein
MWSMFGNDPRGHARVTRKTNFRTSENVHPRSVKTIHHGHDDVIDIAMATALLQSRVTYCS